MEFLESRERMDNSQPGRGAPLPPVTTRWEDPSSGSSLRRGIQLAPPYVPGAPQEQPAEPMPVLRTFDSTPLEEAPAQAPAEASSDAPDPWSASEEPAPSESAPFESADHAVSSEPVRNEPLMPWEEPLITPEPPASHGLSAHASPAVTAESESSDSVPRDLDDWESAIDPDGGQAMPAYGDEESAEDAAFSPPPVLDEEGAVMQQPERADRSFPLDAFIIPPDAKRLPKGLEHAEELHLEIAEALAKRLEDVAQRLRREGFAGLLHHEQGQEPIDTLLAGVLAGYLSNRAEA